MDAKTETKEMDAKTETKTRRPLDKLTTPTNAHACSHIIARVYALKKATRSG